MAWCALTFCLPLLGPAGEALALGAAQHLQEVAPPAAVQQLQEALAERQPRLRILEPATEAVLPAGPWRLRLQVDDWPLVDAGPLGLGPHLLVRIDDGEPLRLTGPEATLPALSPGSHRLTVVAARPWGEAVKSPGALAQIRLHRTAANPLALPAPGSPQLLPVSPAGALAAEPLLLDWVLIDAPLQHLRDDDARWRLRVTVNGDSFLVDRQTPLWLRGWRPGSNALQLELLDGRGEPLNPPFNSLVQEVRLDASAPQPAWSQGRLSPGDLAVLLGQSPPPPTPEPVVPAPEEAEPRTAEAPAVGPLASEPSPAAPAAAPQPVETQAGEPQTAEPHKAQSSPETAPAEEELTAEPPSPDSPAPVQQAPQPGPAETAPAAATMSSPSPPRQGSEAPPSSSSDPRETLEETRPEPAAAAEPSASPEPLSPALRPAREEVNADGTLKREPAQGPLAGLRARLGR
jgi:hypothetical protein